MNTNKNLAKELITEIKESFKGLDGTPLDNVDEYTLIFDITKERRTFAVVSFQGKLVDVGLYKHTEDIDLELIKNFKVKVTDEKLTVDMASISKYIHKVCSAVWLDSYGISGIFNKVGDFTK